MSKGNSGLLSKFQAKLPFSEIGIIGADSGYEVLKEVVLKARCKNASADNKVIVEGRMAIDDEYEIIGIIEGSEIREFHIASFDYVRFSSLIYSASNGAELRTSAYFQDGMFATNAINNMNKDLKDVLGSIADLICGIQDDMNILKTQISIITDHEEDEVK